MESAADGTSPRQTLRNVIPFQGTSSELNDDGVLTSPPFALFLCLSLQRMRTCRSEPLVGPSWPLRNSEHARWLKVETTFEGNCWIWRSENALAGGLLERTRLPLL